MKLDSLAGRTPLKMLFCANDFRSLRAVNSRIVAMTRVIWDCRGDSSRTTGQNDLILISVCPCRNGSIHRRYLVPFALLVEHIVSY